MVWGRGQGNVRLRTGVIGEADELFKSHVRFLGVEKDGGCLGWVGTEVDGLVVGWVLCNAWGRTVLHQRSGQVGREEVLL